MDLCGDAVHDDGFCDLGDCRHQSLPLKNKKLEENDGDNEELQVLDFEVMDSEDEGGEDDVFKAVQYKRAATSVDMGKPQERVVKRANTDPPNVSTRKMKKKKKNKSTDLLTVLLPDNVDTSIVNDFSVLQESTQMTSVLCNEQDEAEEKYQEDLTNLLEPVVPGKNVASHNHGMDQGVGLGNYEEELAESKAISKAEGAQIEEFPNAEFADDSKSELSCVVDQDSSAVAEKEVKKEADEKLEGDHQDSGPEEINCGNDKNRDGSDDNKNKKEKQEREQLVNCSSTKPETHKNEVTEPHDDIPKNAAKSLSRDTTSTITSASAPRPTRRKSTLAELCARKSPVPYRVGLSKKANVNHLHSYLSNK